VGVEGVGADHGAGQVHVGQQRGEAGHLATGAIDLALGQHRPGGVLHRRQQVDLPAVPLGAPQRLAVHRDRPSPLVGTSRSASHAPTHAVKASPSRRARVRRMVASDGTEKRSGASRRAPSAARITAASLGEFGSGIAS
jgi:hypothetical protein